MDAVVAGVTVAEHDPAIHSVGLGGYPNAAGVVELDAAVMDGHNLGYGAVTGLQGIDCPTAVARSVMEHTAHVMLTGQGALEFARSQGFQERDLLLPDARDAWQKWREEGTGSPEDAHDTIGMVALDAAGNLAAACTTSGVAFKLPGRVGDSPLIGCGLYADNEVGAAAATGRGEEIDRVCGSFLIVELMRQGRSPQAACEAAAERLRDRVPTARRHQAAFIALGRNGETGAAAVREGFSYAVRSRGEDCLRAGVHLHTDVPESSS